MIRLSKEGEMIAKTIDWKQSMKDPEYLQQQTEIYDDTLDVRVSFVDANGNLVSDSRQSVIWSENQRQYGEINRR